MTASTCRYCRQPIDVTSGPCPMCGAPIHADDPVPGGAWIRQPPVRDMARIQMGRSSVQIEGLVGPVADLRLDPADSVYFSHVVLLWCDPTARMEALPLAGSGDRQRAGLPLVLLAASGPGHVALSADTPGEVVAVPLSPGSSVMVREHSFLAATRSVDYSWHPAEISYSTAWKSSSGTVDSRGLSPLGRFVDRFAAEEPGLLLLHAPGTVLIKDLGSGEAISVRPEALVYWDPSLGMELRFEYLPSDGDPSASADEEQPWVSARAEVFVHVTGPGRLAITSVFEFGQDDAEGHWAGGSAKTDIHW